MPFSSSRLLSLACVLLNGVYVLSAAVSGDDNVSPRQQANFQQLIANYNQQTLSSLQGSCTQQNVIVRQEWGDMTPQARQDFVRACYCLLEAPSQVNTPGVPGARTRWDDFVAIHAENNDPIHVSNILLGWHRAFGAEVERALRDECGYQFGIPYLDFTRYQNIPMEQWPVFDGSETSLSGNGVPTQDGCSCVSSGPLGNWVVNLGDAGRNGQCRRNPRGNGFGFNPHCLERLFDPSQLEFLTSQQATSRIFGNNDAASFMPSVERGPDFMHGSMHVLIGGTQDFTAFAPGEPIFLLLHAWLDLVYAIWQSLDPSTRFNDLAPPDAYIPLRREQQQGPPPQFNLQSPLPGFEQTRVIDTMSTTNGPYCYIRLILCKTFCLGGDDQVQKRCMAKVLLFASLTSAPFIKIRASILDPDAVRTFFLFENVDEKCGRRHL